MPTTITNDFLQIQPMEIPGGGWVTKYSMLPNGTLLTGGDVYGIWRKKAGEARHTRLLTVSNVTDGDPLNYPNSSGPQGGCYGVAACADAPDTIAFVWNGRVYRRTSDAAKFTACNFAVPLSVATDSNNSTTKSVQKRIVIDPHNPLVMYLGWDYAASGAQGLYYSHDGGVTSNPSTLPLPVSTAGSFGVGAIFIDPTSAVTTTGGPSRQSRIITSSYGVGRGVYVSNDGGLTWGSPLAGSPTTAVISDAAIDSNGNVWATFSDNTLWRISPSNVLTNYTSSLAGATLGVICVAVAGLRIIVMDYQGASYQSVDGGVTWSAKNDRNYTLAAGDSAWIITQTSLTGVSAYLSCTWLTFDGSDTTKMWGLGGQGVWYTTPSLTNYATTPFQITFNSAGTELAVGMGFCNKPDGTNLFNGWDLTGFNVTTPKIPPTKRLFPPDAASIIDVSAIDYLESDPNIMAFTVGRTTLPASVASKYSLDGGTTWNDFATYPPYGSGADKIGGGEIRALSSNHFIWFPRKPFDPYYTVDRGANWLPLTLPGINSATPATPVSPHYGEINNSNALFMLKKHALVVDPLIAGRAWVYHPVAGTFITTNYGVTWTLASSTTFALSIVHSHMKPMWDRSNVMWFTRGTINPTTSPPSGDFAMGVTDPNTNLTTWTVHPDIKAVSDFAFGPKKNGQAYPDIYFYGCVNGATLGASGFGLYSSEDNCVTVKKHSDVAVSDIVDWACGIGASRVHKKFVQIAFNGSTASFAQPSPPGKQVIWTA